MKLSPIETTEQRLERLEARVAELAAAVGRLEARAAPARLREPPPGIEADSELDEESFAELAPKAGSVLPVLTALGTSFLVLGGALLIRTITDAGAVPRTAGIAVGFAYAVAWILVAIRLAGRGRRVGASFLGVTAVAIGDPLLFEAVTRFHAVGPWTAAAALVLLTGACLAAGRRRNLGAVAWVAVLTAAATAAALSIATGTIAPYAAALLSIGIAAVWLVDGALLWRSLRWPAAGAADVMVFGMAWAAQIAGETAAGAHSETPVFLVPLALALPILYVGSFLAQTILLRREVGAFEALQSFAAMAIGLGGAVAAARSTGAGTGALGAAALVAGALCYAAALGLLERRESRRDVSWCAAVALALSLFGSALLFPGAAVAWLWLLLALGSAIASSRHSTLRLHAAAFAAAGALQSGLAAATFESLFPVTIRFPASFSGAAFASIVVAAACLPMISRDEASRAEVAGRVGRLGLAVIACFGAAGYLVALLRPIAGASGGVDPGAMALIRSAVLAAGAVALAALRRRTSLPEFGWLAYAVVVLAGIKLLVEDVPAGRALTLFLAFAFYGAALLSIPKLLRAVRSAPASS